MPISRTQTEYRVFWETPTMRAAENGLDRAATRQRLLTQNLANVNTPGYQRQDLPFSEQLERSQNRALALSNRSSFEPAMRVTDPRHIAHAPASSARLAMPETLRQSMRFDGSSVNPEMEMAAMAENELRYATLIRIASGQISGLQRAINSGRGGQ